MYYIDVNVGIESTASSLSGKFLPLTRVDWWGDKRAGVHNMLNIYPKCRIFYLPSIDTGTRDRQFNISSEWHPAGILLMKICGQF